MSRVRAQVLVVDTEGATTPHTELLVATPNASGIKNHYASILKGTSFQTAGCKSLAGYAINLMGQDQHFFKMRTMNTIFKTIECTAHSKYCFVKQWFQMSVCVQARSEL